MNFRLIVPSPPAAFWPRSRRSKKSKQFPQAIAAALLLKYFPLQSSVFCDNVLPEMRIM
jgi:hypothetical protein